MNLSLPSLSEFFNLNNSEKHFKAKAEQKLKEMLNPAPNPKLLEAFQQAATPETIKNQPVSFTVQPPANNQPTTVMINTAAAVNQAASVVVEEVLPIEIPTNAIHIEELLPSEIIQAPTLEPVATTSMINQVVEQVSVPDTAEIPLSTIAETTTVTPAEVTTIISLAVEQVSVPDITEIPLTAVAETATATSAEATKIISLAVEQANIPDTTKIPLSTIAETATATEVPSQATDHAKTALLSRIISNTITTLKAAPGKAFLCLTVPVLAYLYNEENKLSNVTIVVDVKTKKLVTIEIGSDKEKKYFQLTVEPGKELEFIKDLPHDRSETTKLMPSSTRSTTFLGRCLSPITSMVCARVNEERIYNLWINNYSETPFSSKPIVKSVQLSEDEILRITHVPMNDQSVTQQEKIYLNSEEALELEPEEDLFDDFYNILVKVADEPERHEPFPGLPDNQYVAIKQILL